jgi:hypothetical protein
MSYALEAREVSTVNGKKKYWINLQVSDIIKARTKQPRREDLQGNRIKRACKTVGNGTQAPSFPRRGPSKNLAARIVLDKSDRMC